MVKVSSPSVVNNCPDLQWLVRGIYRTGRDPAAEADDLDLWLTTLPGRYGLIYPHGRDRLVVEVEDPRIAARVAAALGGAAPYQRGWRFWSYTFPVSLLGPITAITQPAKVRRMSASAKKRLSAIGKDTRFRGPGTALDSARERQESAEGSKTAIGPSVAAGAIVTLA